LLKASRPTSSKYNPLQNNIYPPVAKLPFPRIIVEARFVFAEGEHPHHFGRQGVGDEAFADHAGAKVGEAEVVFAVTDVVGMPLYFNFVALEVGDVVEELLQAGAFVGHDVIATATEEDAVDVVLVRWGGGVLTLGAAAGAK
jgi:hypothetical protein